MERKIRINGEAEKLENRFIIEIEESNRSDEQRIQ
jgi:hypothetical protein